MTLFNRIARAGTAAALVAAPFALATAAHADPHHSHCTWVVRHHHKEKVCR